MSEIIKRLSLAPLIEEYNQKVENINSTINDFKDAITTLNANSLIQGNYSGAVKSYYPPCDREVLKSLRVSAWNYVYENLNIKLAAPASDRARIERVLQDPDDFNMENLRKVFGEYIRDPRHHVLRGLAEAFCNLDNAYKSHSKVKFGVDKLPKRAIFTNVLGDYSGLSYGYSADRFVDTINALLLYQEKGQVTRQDVAYNLSPDTAFKRVRTKDGFKNEPINYKQIDGVTFKKFANGNVHVHFDKQTLIDINKALSEFYGDVLPDVATKEEIKTTSTALSKDLQYYPTPEKVADKLCSEMWGKDLKILEPECGCGRILMSARKAKPDAYIAGYEVHNGRAEEARQKGFNVITSNFLEVAPSPEFDYILMNPPFYGKHYLKHIEHAIKFLKDGGELRAILPSTAWYDYKKLPNSGNWIDLPVGSFSESGTNVNTGIWKYKK